MRHTVVVPKLWTDTIEAHKQAVREALLDTTAHLVAAHGLAAVTMSKVAEQAGIGRATLYKYFPDVESMLTAWHERQVAEHVHQLIEVRDHASSPADRLEAVLMHYAEICYHHHDGEVVAMLHRGEHVARAQNQLRALIRDLIVDGVASGQLRDDIAAAELATYCLHALTGAGELPSKAPVRRLVGLTLASLLRPA